MNAQANTSLKKTRPFLSVLKQMLGIYRFGPVPLVFWLLFCGIVFYFSAVFSPMEWMRGHDTSDFAEAQVMSTVFVWFFLMMISTPLPSQILEGISSLEFMFTRAIDRAFWLRIERVAIIVLAVGPLLINLALSPWELKLAFDPAEPGSSAAATQAQYVSAFPGSHATRAETTQAPQLVIRHGTEMFAAWLVWLALMGIFLVAGYFTWAFTLWQKAGWHHSKSRWRPWLGAFMVYAPTFSVIPLFIFSLVARTNVYEESFLFFARHPLPMAGALVALAGVVQPLSERNIRKLEFEFF